MVALLQNGQTRSDQAVQHKLSISPRTALHSRAVEHEASRNHRRSRLIVPIAWTAFRSNLAGLVVSGGLNAAQMIVSVFGCSTPQASAPLSTKRTRQEPLSPPAEHDAQDGRVLARSRRPPCLAGGAAHRRLLTVIAGYSRHDARTPVETAADDVASTPSPGLAADHWLGDLDSSVDRVREAAHRAARVVGDHTSRPTRRQLDGRSSHANMEPRHRVGL